jgi:hypothetical protein
VEKHIAKSIGKDVTTSLSDHDVLLCDLAPAKTTGQLLGAGRNGKPISFPHRTVSRKRMQTHVLDFLLQLQGRPYRLSMRTYNMIDKLHEVSVHCDF